MNDIVTAKVYASLSREQTYNIGHQLGLSDDACRYLSYFNEVELSIRIDKSTGEVISASTSQSKRLSE